MSEDDLPSLEELDKSIKEARDRSLPKDIQKKKVGDVSDVMRMSIEIVAGIVVGTFIGYWLDKLFDTLPLFLILCFCLGVAGSALNIYRMVKQELSEDDTE